MTRSRQMQFLLDLLEGLPSVGFILLWRQTGDLQFAGWFGCGLAFVVFMVFAGLKARMNPVLLGVNLHILLVTPLMVGLFRFGNTALAEFLVGYSYGAVLITVTLTGAVLSAFTREGFAAAPDLPANLRRRLSLAMLFVAGSGAAWAIWMPGNSLLPVVVTLTGLIVGRRFLLLRWSGDAATGLVVAGTATSGSAQSDLVT
ncbi:hypothetical protein CHH27_12365 [Labrenzia sp. VG12]|nr:hypothetical protein CHH27_12365 [Labrenzia sp. VG12]